jgi:hypothetical protein
MHNTAFEGWVDHAMGAWNGATSTTGRLLWQRFPDPRVIRSTLAADEQEAKKVYEVMKGEHTSWDGLTFVPVALGHFRRLSQGPLRRVAPSFFYVPNFVHLCQFLANIRHLILDFHMFTSHFARFRYSPWHEFDTLLPLREKDAKSGGKGKNAG